MFSQKMYFEMHRPQISWVECARFDCAISNSSKNLKHQFRDTLTPMRVDYTSTTMEYVVPICV
jgi:hypothetical protein